MNRWRIVSGLALTVFWTISPYEAFGQHQHGQQETGQPVGQHTQKDTTLPLCPVMENPVDFNVKTMTDQGPVYFCCEDCVKKYQDNPEKYAKKTEAQRAALKQMKRIQVNCPVTGNPIDGKTFIMSDGKGVSFCCPNCVPKYEKEPAKYAAKLEAAYTYQTRCPVSGGKIDPTAYTDLPTGDRIYLCCPGCGDKLLRDPAKYAPKLASQGININVAKISGKSSEGKHPEAKHDHKGHDNP